MGGLRSLAEKAGIAGELLGYFWERKLWWLIPMVTLLVIMGMVMIFAQGSAVAPFIYTLF